MSTYYTPRQQASSSHSQNATLHREVRHRLPDMDLDVGDHSIYVFPDPSVEPPSPASSLFSPATSFDASTSSLFSPSSRSASRTRTSSRALRHAPSLSTESSRSLRRGHASTGSASSSSKLRPYHAVEQPSPDLDPDIGEVWDWTGSRSHLSTSADSDASWVLEERIERASRWDFDSRLRQFAERASASVIPHQRPRLAPLRTRLHTRTTSRSSGSLAAPSRRTRSLSSARPPSPSPQPRIRIPLLSLFAALLALDLDDPALRLLTQSAPADADCVLFPGTPYARLLQSGEGDKRAPASYPEAGTEPQTGTESTGEASMDGRDLKPDPPAMHGIHKLLSSMHDPSGAALRSLRAGLAIAAMPGEFVVGVPGVRELAGLWRAVGEVCLRGGQAWREVWVSG